MANSSRKYFFLTALLAFSLGYRSNPFKISPKPDSEKVQGQYQKMRDYYYNGNYEGALVLAREIQEMAPHYADIDEQIRRAQEAVAAQKPQLPERLPASLRDSYYDAKIAYNKGECEEVRESLRPIGRFEKSFDYQKIYETCKNKKEKKITE